MARQTAPLVPERIGHGRGSIVPDHFTYCKAVHVSSLPLRIRYVQGSVATYVTCWHQAPHSPPPELLGQVTQVPSRHVITRQMVVGQAELLVDCLIPFLKCRSTVSSLLRMIKSIRHNETSPWSLARLFSSTCSRYLECQPADLLDYPRSLAKEARSTNRPTPSYPRPLLTHGRLQDSHPAQR